MTEAERNQFDRLLDGVMDRLPRRLRSLLEEVPVIVLDRPTPELLAELGDEEDDELLCGLHTGVSMTERSVDDSGVVPSDIHLFREGIVAMAGGWGGEGGEGAVEREIRTTLLHEIGHQFGLEEGDLEDLGYG